MWGSLGAGGWLPAKGWDGAMLWLHLKTKQPKGCVWVLE